MTTTTYAGFIDECLEKFTSFLAEETKSYLDGANGQQILSELYAVKKVIEYGIIPDPKFLEHAIDLLGFVITHHEAAAAVYKDAVEEAEKSTRLALEHQIFKHKLARVTREARE